MQYPFVIFSEWKATNEPLFYETRNGDEYCVISAGKYFKSKDEDIRDTIRIQCFGDECQKIKYLIEKNGGIKGIPLDIYADMIPYTKEGVVYHNYRATKISTASSYYEQQKETKKVPDLINQLDTNPFGFK